MSMARSPLSPEGRLPRPEEVVPAGQPPLLQAPPGLRGVVVADTAIGDVRGTEGFFHYRQYSALDLAAGRSLEDVWHLLLLGVLPTRAEADGFARRVRSRRHLPEPVAEVLPAIANASHGSALDGLRTALSLLGCAEGFRPRLDVTADELRDQALRVAAVVPTLVAALHRVGAGRSPVAPDPELGHAANYLYMLTGRHPDARRARALEQYLILTIDHGFNASTFAARVATSTGADLVAAVVAAVAAFSGPLHGGAPSRALETLDAIGSPERAGQWVRDAYLRGERIMGFGHAVYRTEDPRARMLRDIARSLGGPLVDFATEVEAEVLRALAELKPGRRLSTNVEFYAGVVMEQCGLDRSLFTPTFAVSRTIGWCAHILEQASDERIIRPSSRYVGPPPPQPVPAA